MRYIGDDLINLMTVSISPAEGQELPEIVAVDVKIGCLLKHYDHPNNPLTIDVIREESIKLSTVNKVYAAIWYRLDGKTYKKTCEGSFTLPTKPEVVNGGCQC